MKTETNSLLQLGMIKGIGNTCAINLLQYFQCAGAVFESSFKELSHLVGAQRAHSILSHKPDLLSIENEIAFMEAQDICVISVLDDQYPEKLRNIPDAPYLLFYKGNALLNATRQISIVGTREPSEYGKEWTKYIVDALEPYNVTVVSGMARGIDGIAHKQSLVNQISTIGVLAHGLDRIYPEAHKRVANDMINAGGLLTEYRSQTIPERQNFPMRNRIVAGMTDATLVVETDVKGGAMITAKLALSYDREVMAVPGRVKDSTSSGCNYLIKTQMAQLVCDVEDIVQVMGWEEPKASPRMSIQSRLFMHCNERETKIIDLMEHRDMIHIDELQLKSGMRESQLANILLQLEFQDIVTALPGKRFKLNCA